MNVFTYGSLMFADIWRDVTGNEDSGVSASIDGYQRVYIQGDVYPVLKPSISQKALLGVLYYDVSRLALEKLDRFEGEYYQRVEIKVTAGNNQLATDANVYLLKAEFEHLATSRIWTPEDFEVKHKEQFRNSF